ncbi:MAG TPA: hydrogenase formation protein HypD [Desulfobacterales bacterium]
MALKHMEEYRDADLARPLAEKIRSISTRPVRLMEVCGTHTVSIFRSGIRSLLPQTVTLLSGPGCPVCVTAQGEIDAFVALARQDNVILTTFGDLMRVPGSGSSLQRERSNGRDVRIVYSTLDALEIARKHPDKQVVFPGVGFETTAPTIAAAIQAADQTGVENFSVYSAHKLVPPALEALMSLCDVGIDGFLLPGHVSVIIGLDGYRAFFERHRVPSVVAGFEPVDLLRGIGLLVEQIETGAPLLENAYGRAVTDAGNPAARKIMDAVFEVSDANWRGIGTIAHSGLSIRERYAAHDARRAFALDVAPAVEPRGCACGEILIGTKIPPQCPLYRTVCTPVDPVGPCMVSSEGTCAAYYRYDTSSTGIAKRDHD